jgi:F420-non-reducing hydrogenase small subunit
MSKKSKVEKPAEKPKIALTWFASCGGCEEAVVDIAERILDLVNLVDIVYWPVALDFKVSDLEAMPDGSITASLINGGIRNSENKEIAELLRKKSKVIIAYGACSAWGGIPGLANLYDMDDVLSRAYLETPTTVNEEKVLPQTSVNVEGVELPETYPTLKPLDQVIDVDYYIPGCPPTADVTWTAIGALIAALQSGNFPPKGAVIGASDKALCYECKLNETKPDKLQLKELKRPHQVMIDPEKCYLEQGLLCLGPVTRGGCSAEGADKPLCVNAGMCCSGCFGPLDEVEDYGGKGATFIASALDYENEEDIKKALDGMPDPVGTLYRYSLPASSLRGKVGRKR